MIDHFFEKSGWEICELAYFYALGEALSANSQPQ